MAFTYFDLMYQAMNRVGLIDNRVLTATGLVTTAVCSDLTTEYSATDVKDNILFMANTTDGLAPKGEFARMTTMDTGTGTITLASSLSAVTHSGDEVGIGKATVPYLVMKQLANSALSGLGTIDLVDTSLTTATAQTEYTLPLVVKRQPLKVEVQGITTDANDNRWWELKEWHVTPATAGTQNLLIIPQLSSGYTLKLWYRDVHPTLTAYNSPVVETVHPELAIALLIEKIQIWRLSKTVGAAPAVTEFANASMAGAREAKALYPIKRVTQGRQKIFTMSENTSQDEFTWPSP